MRMWTARCERPCAGEMQMRECEMRDASASCGGGLDKCASDAGARRSRGCGGKNKLGSGDAPAEVRGLTAMGMMAVVTGPSAELMARLTLVSL